MSRPENVFARDLDGTGSLHVCMPDDPGAMEFVAIDDSTRLALREAVERFTELAEEEDLVFELLAPGNDKNAAERAAAEYRRTAQLLERLTGEGE